MHPRARALAVSGIDATLSALGYPNAERKLARGDVVDWARARLQARRARTGIVSGVRIVVTARGRAELRPFDGPLAGPGQVTVETLVSAVSPGTERAQWLRLPNAQLSHPYTPGYSGAGRVIRSGVDDAGFGKGDLVAIAKLPHASVGTVSAGWVTPVPSGVAIADAALVYLAIIAGYGVRRAGLASGDSLVVVGAGPIGALAQRLAALRDPAFVTVVAATRRRERATLGAGADRFVTSDEDLSEIGAGVAVEATGDPAALGAAVAAARPGGTVVLLGSPRGRTPTSIVADAQEKGLRLVGAHISALVAERARAGDDPFQSLAREYIAALAAGSIDVTDLAGEPLDPREPQLSYRRLAHGDIGAAHFNWSLVPRSRRVRLRSALSGPVLAPPRSRMRVPADRSVPRSAGRLRFAVIGCGDIGLHNARAIAAAANAEVALCHDPVEALAEATAREVGGDVARELEAALDSDRVDAVCVCTPHDLHAPIGESAAAAGLHIVVEKPLANELAHAQRTVDAAASAGVALSVCFPYRYEPALRAARQLVRDGALGAFRGANVVFHIDKPESYWLGGFSGRSPSSWRGSRVRAGGGVLIMNLTHYVDFIRFVAGAEAERITAGARHAGDAEVEDSIAMTVEFRGGGLGAITASASTRGAPPSRFEMWGEHGTLRLEPDPALYSERALGEVPAGRWCDLPVNDGQDPRVTYFERFVEAVQVGRPPDVSPADGLAVQLFVDAAYRAAEEGSRVSVASPQLPEVEQA